jgi:23S rRNA pseudouridine2604 synthase
MIIIGNATKKHNITAEPMACRHYPTKCIMTVLKRVRLQKTAPSTKIVPQRAQYSPAFVRTGPFPATIDPSTIRRHRRTPFYALHYPALMTNSIRLSKRLAAQIACSRQEAEQYIAGGWVKVDEHIIEEPGFRIQPEQQIELLPQANLAPIVPISILLHKPAGTDMASLMPIIGPDTLIANDRSGLRFLKRHTTDLNPTDSLPRDASGLLVLTQDWRILRKLVDDTAKTEQEFIVEVSGDIAENGLALLNHGLRFNGKPLPPMKVSWQNETRLRFALRGGQTLPIQHMCEKVGLQVLSLKRLRIGRISMASLPVGQWRYLLGYERF